MAAPTPAKIDRQSTTPFLLRLFYKQNAFHRIESFDPAGRLPPNLQIYTWHTCSLRELSTLLLTALPSLLPAPYAGTRIAFHLIYGDMSAPVFPRAPARFVSRDLGSVIIGAQGEEVSEEGDAVKVSEALKQLDGEPEKTLGDAKFVIGDYISCAIFPPLPDGSVQAAPPVPAGPSRGPPPREGFAGGPRAWDYQNGYGRGRGDYGYGRDSRRGGRYEDRRASGGLPSGEWRRGEAPPERTQTHMRGGAPERRGRGERRW